MIIADATVFCGDADKALRGGGMAYFIEGVTQTIGHQVKVLMIIADATVFGWRR